jgi:DNA/RNA non-specific endonuclease
MSWRRHRSHHLRAAPVYGDAVEPLHQPPTRPIVDFAGTVVNPLACSAPITLDDSTPLAYSDLLPNTRYVSPGFEYLTDDHALPARVRGALRLVPAAQRLRHPTVQGAAGRLASSPEGAFQGGHIVAVSLGGFASGPNLFPQQHNFNISAYARLEHGWRRTLTDEITVEVDIALALGPDPAVPEFVIVTYWEDGEEWEHALLNEPNSQ